MFKLKCCLLVVCVSISSIVMAQATYELYIGPASTLGSHKEVLFDVGVGGGYTFYKNLTLDGGVNFKSYKLRRDKASENMPDTLTYSIRYFAFYGAVKYSIRCYTFRDGTKSIGLLPELKTYYAPRLPYKIDYLNYDNLQETFKGAKQSQLAFGYGMGVFLGDIDGPYVYLSGEWNNVDVFESLAGFERYDLPNGHQFLLKFGVVFK